MRAWRWTATTDHPAAMAVFLRPQNEWPAPAPGQPLGILTDIDRTLTTDGAITPDALQALAALKTSGLHV
jgi:hypothetical protein